MSSPAPLYPVTLADVKAHLRLDTSDSDAYLSDLLIPAAAGWCEQYLNQTFEDFTDIPAEVKFAILIVAADLYEFRTITLDVQRYENPAAERLLHPYRVELGV